MKRSAFLAIIGVAGLAPIAISGSGMQDGYKGMLVDLWDNKKLVGSGQIVYWDGKTVVIEMWKWLVDGFWNKKGWKNNSLRCVASDDLKILTFSFQYETDSVHNLKGTVSNVEVYYKWKQ